MKSLPVDDSHSRRRKKEPHVGIFWLVDGKLVIDNTALSMSEDYGVSKVHPGDHISVWRSFSAAELFLPAWSTRNGHVAE